MRRLLFSAVIVGAGWVALAPAMATSSGLPSLNGPKITAMPIEKVGYWKRQYRRYGYPAPYAPTETTHPHKATTATIRPQMETIHLLVARMAIIRLMALNALS